MKGARRVGIQYAALPYRRLGRRLSVLLISSRGTGRWVIPKGWPIRALAPHEAAAHEAFEEAGVVGEVSSEPLGSYDYLKEVKDGGSLAVQVIVFPLEVERFAEHFKEEGQRTSSWFRPHEAAQRVAEPSLRRLILDFEEAHSTNPLVRGLRRYRHWRLRASGDETL